MPIKIMATEHGDKPIIVCDVCGARIERSDDGAYAWNDQPPIPGRMHDMAFVHKGDCLLTYEAEQGASSTSDMPLDVLLPYLAVNLELDWEAATKLASTFPAAD